MAQEITGLLGETTAETKATLTKLCHSLLEGTAVTPGMQGGELEQEIQAYSAGKRSRAHKSVMTARGARQAGAGRPSRAVPGTGEQKKPQGAAHPPRQQIRAGMFISEQCG